MDIQIVQQAQGPIGVSKSFDFQPAREAIIAINGEQWRSAAPLNAGDACSINTSIDALVALSRQHV